MLDYIRKFEKIMYITLIILLGGVVVFSIAELVWLLYEGFVQDSRCTALINY